MPFDAILIDFYGTITAGDREAVEAACARIVRECNLPATPQAFAIEWGERFFATVAASNHDDFRTLYECELTSLEATLAARGVRRDPRPFVADLEAYWSDPPLHADAVAFLSRVKVPVCCVSNADTAHVAGVIERHGLRFNALITSEDVRCYKPEAGIFQSAMDRLGVRPERAVHIGDSLHSDIGGAAALGIATAWLCRESRIHDIGTCPADHTISSLDELAHWF